MRYVVLLFYSFIGLSGFSQLKIGSLEELYLLADSASFDLKISNQELYLAEITNKAAKGNIFNPRIPVSGNLTNNTELPVNFIPGESFGGQPGSLREITLGQQYVSALTINPQIDLFNPARWQDVRSSQLNHELSRANREADRLQLRNELASFYIGILSLKEQRSFTKRSLELADSIHRILQNKWDMGLLRLADLNSSRMNVLKQRQLLMDIDLIISSQLIQISQFFGREIVIEGNLSDCVQSEEVSNGPVLERLFQIKKLYSEGVLKASRWDQLPTIALVSSFAWQNNSNIGFLDNSQRWIYSNYIGLKLSWDLPTNVNKLALVGQNRVKANIAIMELEREVFASRAKVSKMKIEIERAENNYKLKKELAVLEKENFNISLDLFSRDILSPDKLLERHIQYVQAQLNEQSALADWCIQIRKYNNGY